MLFVYKPEGVDEARKWKYEPGKIRAVEAEAIEKKTGWGFRGEFQKKLGQGSVLASHALLWVFLKRDEPSLRWEQVDFTADEVDFEYPDEELIEVADLLRQKRDETGLTEDEEEALAALEKDYPAAGDGEDPKALTSSEPNESSTSSSSPT